MSRAEVNTIVEKIVPEMILSGVERHGFYTRPLDHLAKTLRDLEYPRANVRFRLSRTIVETMRTARTPSRIVDELGPDTVLDALLHYVGILPLVPGGLPPTKLAELRTIWRSHLQSVEWLREPLPEPAQRHESERAAAPPDVPSKGPPLDVGNASGTPGSDQSAAQRSIIVFDEAIEDLPDRGSMSLLPYENLRKEPVPIKAVEAETILRLKDRYPWARDLIDRLYTDLRNSQDRVGPHLLWGKPGIGKSKLARDIAECLGLPYTLIPAGGYSDSSFAGTSRRYVTAHPSVPAALISRKNVANPVVIIDELDKAGGSSRNGVFHDALLGMLEPDTAECWHDPCLDARVNLKHVGWIATANTIDSIPEMLRDRFTILKMPAPGPNDAAAIIESIWRDVEWRDPLWTAIASKGWDVETLFAKSRAPIEPDEIQAIKDLWQNTAGTPSLRRLQRIVERWVQRKHAAPSLAN